MKHLPIIECLRNDARMTLTQMSRKTGVPISTIHEWLKSFSGGLVKKHTSLIDFTKLGYRCRAEVLIGVPQAARNELKEHLQKHPNVNNAYKINNGYSYFIETIFKDIDELDAFLEQLEANYGVTDTKTYYIIDELKNEAFMTDMALVSGVPPQHIRQTGGYAAEAEFPARNSH